MFICIGGRSGGEYKFSYEGIRKERETNILKSISLVRSIFQKRM